MWREYHVVIPGVIEAINADFPGVDAGQPLQTTSKDEDFASQEDIAICEQECLVAPGWELDIPPAVTAFAPTYGNPGTPIVITGTYLTAASAVTLAGNPVTSFTVDSPTQITAVAPATGPSGPLRVVTPAGTATSATNFTLTNPAPPTLTAFSPTSGSIRTAVTLTGTNFTGATAVRFGTREAASFTVVSPTQIIAHPPDVVMASGTSGGKGASSNSVIVGPYSAKISVVTPAGTATSAADFSVVEAPFDPPPGGGDDM